MKRNGTHHYNKNRRVVFRRKCLSVLATLAIVIFFVTVFSVTNSSAKEEHSYEKYYTSIQIQEGDCLWDIAKEYSYEAHISPEDYIEEVKQINHLCEDEIYSGQYLTIPYYTAQIK